MRSKRNPHQGIRIRHGRSCSAGSPEPVGCTCKPSYEAQVWSSRDGKAIRKTFRSLSEAKGWRADTTSALRKGTVRAPAAITLREAAMLWLEGVKEGSLRNRSGDSYKPSTIRSYEQSLKTRVLPEIGGAKLSAIGRPDVQDLVDRLIAEGLDPSTIRNTVMPLRSICRRAIARGEIAVNPTTGVELPAVRGRRDRIASREEANALIEALPDPEKALWATAFYGGLRRGELMGLTWENVDLASGLISVIQSYDPKAKLMVSPKSRAGERRVPITQALRDHLIAHRLRSGRGEGLVLGEDSRVPFNYDPTVARARRAWREAELSPIGLHEARHTFASLMIAARVNAKALSVYMGHASITITLDRYGHLMPGNEAEAAGLLDAYLAAETV